MEDEYESEKLISLAINGEKYHEIIENKPHLSEKEKEVLENGGENIKVQKWFEKIYKEVCGKDYTPSEPEIDEFELNIGKLLRKPGILYQD